MYRQYGKRILDVLLSGSALLLAMPIMALVAAAIRLEDGAAVLFHQQRIGRNGQPFTLLKFRSMPINTADIPSERATAVKVTRVGKFIRRTNIDELPQLINILRGDMSVVGPRPALVSQADLCAMRRTTGALDCAPGLTGLAQINAYDGMRMEEKAAWDARYSADVSWLLDARIILATCGYLLKRPPVY